MAKRPPKTSKTRHGNSKFNAANRAKILDAIADGASVEVAARSCGISGPTLYRWLSPEDSPGDDFEDFRSKVKTAEGEYEKQLLSAITLAGNEWTEERTKTVTVTKPDGSVQETTETVLTPKRGDWHALAWILERTKPERYAKREVTEITGEASVGLEPQDFVGAPIKFELKIVGSDADKQSA